jgi:hypothetical protein
VTGAAGPDERINFRDVVNVISGLALGQRLPRSRPNTPRSRCWSPSPTASSWWATRCALAGGTRTKDANAILDALEMLDGDRVDPARSRYAQVLNRLKAKGTARC